MYTVNQDAPFTDSIPSRTLYTMSDPGPCTSLEESTDRDLTYREYRILMDILPDLLQCIKQTDSLPRPGSELKGAPTQPILGAILPGILRAIELSSESLARDLRVVAVRKTMAEVEDVRLKLCPLMVGLNAREPDTAKFLDRIGGQIQSLSLESERMSSMMLKAWVQWRLQETGPEQVLMIIYGIDSDYSRLK